MHSAVRAEFSTATFDHVQLGYPGDMIATRITNGALLRALHGQAPLWGGSADLAGSTAVEVDVVMAATSDRS